MRALLGVVVLLALAGSAAAATNPIFRRADGSAIVFPGAVRAWCDGSRLNVVTLTRRLRDSRWQLEIARKHVRSGSVIRFSWRRPNGIGIFVYDAKTRNEASEGPEGSHGVVTIRRGTCRRGGAVAISLSGTIASEFFDGKPIRVSGTYRGTIGSRPG